MIGTTALRTQLAGSRIPPGAPAPPPRVPLHIHATRVTTVELDGPALRIRATGRAIARYPLARISRIVVRGAVLWRGEALTALMETGIPVVLLDGAGKTLGYCWPVNRPSVPFVVELGEFLGRPDWQERHANWLRSTRMRVLQHWRRRRETAGQPVTEGQFAEWVHRHVYAYRSHELTPTDNLRRGAVAAVVATQLSSAGLAPCYWGVGDAQLHLARDVTDVLDLVLECQLGDFAASARADDPARLRLLGPAMTRLPRHCTALLRRFTRWVRETIDTCH
ncbi:MAG: CRISPR-associated endonuclease Cas1 [Chromatiales bacterium]